MIRTQLTGWAAVLGAGLLLSASSIATAGPYTASPGDLVAGNIVNTIDENGHATLNAFLGPQPEPFALQNDPGPGGLANVLTYSLLNPPGLTAGDLLINEPETVLGTSFASTRAKGVPMAVWAVWFSIRLPRLSTAWRIP